MTAETVAPSSFLTLFALPEQRKMPHGYFRSKLFVASFAANPLVAAAGPLFSLLERLNLSSTLPPVGNIRESIEHELHAFHSRLTGASYSEELVHIAHYLLAATIDELLGKNYLRLYGTPAEFKAFTPSSADEIGPEKRVFEILDFMKDKTNQYLDLLELGYYCLIAGFEGEQHLRADGRQRLENLIEELYQTIQSHRVHKPERLFKEPTTAMPLPINYKPAILGGVLALMVLGCIYLASHLLIEHKAKAVLENSISVMNQED